MKYNGFVVVDTRDSTGTESNYDTPALPGGGGSTPAATNAPLPGLGGPGWNNNTDNNQSSGGNKNWQQWVTPETIGATLQLAGSVTNMIAAGKTGDTAKIKAVCGQQPLLNIGGKKDTYRACAERVTNAGQQVPVYMPPMTDTGMSTSAKVMIGAAIFIFLLLIVVVAIILIKKQAKVSK